MAAKQLGEFLLKGTVVINWDNGQTTEVGTVQTYVQMSIGDDEPVTLAATTKES